MNRNRHGSKRRRQRLRYWSYPQARRALPYVASVMRSVREHWLEAVRHDVAVRRLAAQPGRPNRDRLIAQEKSRDASHRAGERLEEAAEELRDLDIYCLDPVCGEALIPFRHDSRLAWFVYSHFEKDPLRYWRYHDDSLETRRPLAEALSENSL
jgi:hypothetical protein